MDDPSITHEMIMLEMDDYKTSCAELKKQLEGVKEAWKKREEELKIQREKENKAWEEQNEKLKRQLKKEKEAWEEKNEEMKRQLKHEKEAWEMVKEELKKQLEKEKEAWRQTNEELMKQWEKQKEVWELTSKELQTRWEKEKETTAKLQKEIDDLNVMIQNHFDSAAAGKDTASMERFFKLFPLLNDHTNGLQRFGAHLCRKIDVSCKDFIRTMNAGGTDEKRRNVLYSDTMTMILEETAREVMECQPLIDSHCDPDKLLYLMKIIQVECDKQTTLVLDAFIKNRQFEKRAKIVREYLRDGHATEKLDPIALDVLLSEVTLIHTRTALYWRFLRRRLGEIERKDVQAQQEDPQIERAQVLNSIVNRSKLATRMQEILGDYVMMEQYYMQESVSKALETEDAEEGSLTTSILDDVFFIVRKCIRRSITSSSVDCVCAMINNGMTLMETKYLEKLHTDIREGYPSTSWTAGAYQHAQTAYNVIQHGKSVAKTGSETKKKAFLAALNNTRASIQSIATLKEGLKHDFDAHLKQVSATDKGKLEHSVSQFDELSQKLQQMTSLGVTNLCVAAFRPRIKATAETYIDVTHQLTEEQLSGVEAVEPFIEIFIAQLDEQIDQFRDLLFPDTYEKLLEVVCGEATKQMERVIFNCGFNHLGGIQLDKEVRLLVSYLIGISNWKVREKCTKISQMANILASPSLDDALTFFNQLEKSSNGIRTVKELKKILSLRIDFPKEQIKALIIS